jgi:hypothetical protein
MESFVKALSILKVEPIIIFAQAFDYFEVRFTEDIINQTFGSCCVTNDKGQTLLVRVPLGVQLYLNEVLLGVARPLNEQSNLDSLEIWTGEVKGEK